MKLEEFRRIVREEVNAALQERLAANASNSAPEDPAAGQQAEKPIAERTVSRREPPRKMTPGQVQKRDKIGKAMKGRPAVVSKFKKKYGQNDWEYYLWASATNQALRS